MVADNRGGARSATRHLLGHGHRHIGVVGPRADRFTVVERVAGFRGALHAGGDADVAESLRLDCDTSAEALAATLDLLALPTPPTALFAVSNLCAIGAARGLREAGLEHDVALVGFDDFETADLLDPPLTVVAQDPEEIGRQAARRLFSRLAGDDGPAQTIVTPTRLIMRGSGEIRAAAVVPR